MKKNLKKKSLNFLDINKMGFRILAGVSPNFLLIDNTMFAYCVNLSIGFS